MEHGVGQVQWARDGFGLGAGRDLKDYPRYKIIGNAKMGESSAGFG